MHLILQVSRFSPANDTRPYFREYSLEMEPHAKVLDALLEARRTDPTLSFRRSCRSSICGSCAVALNGKPTLACQTQIAEAADDRGVLRVEPLPTFRQIKDLVVDLDPFFDSLKAVVPWLLPVPAHGGRVSPEDTAAIESPATCILCGVCDAAVKFPGEVRPAAAVKGWRMALDPRDRLGAERTRLLDVPLDVLRLFVRELPRTCPKGVELSEKLFERRWRDAPAR